MVFGMTAPVTHDPDKHLVENFQQGDVSAFNQLVLKYRHRVMGVATRMLGDRVEAEDLAQDVFVKVYRSMKGFRGDSLFSTWLYRITANSCLNHRRKGGQENRIVEFSEESGSIVSECESNPHSLLEEKELKLCLERAIEELPQEQRIVLLLRDVEGLSYEAIAESLELELVSKNWCYACHNSTQSDGKYRCSTCGTDY